MTISDLEDTPVFSCDRSPAVQELVLMVGLDSEYTYDLDVLGLPQHAQLLFTGLSGLRRRPLQTHRLDLVVCPLIGQNCDAIEIAQALTEVEYSGRLRVLCLPFRRRDMIAHELKQVAGHVEVELHVIPNVPNALALGAL